MSAIKDQSVFKGITVGALIISFNDNLLLTLSLSVNPRFLAFLYLILKMILITPSNYSYATN